MTQIGKFAIVASAVGAIGGTGAYASGLFDSSPKKAKQEIIKINIKTALAQEGFKVLNTKENSNEWKAVLAEYIKATKRSFTGVEDKDRTEEQLRQECDKIFGKNSEEKQNYSLGKQWCVEKMSMKKVLENGRRKLLSFDGPEVPNEKEEWEKKIEKLKQNKEKFSAIKEKIKDQEETSGDNIKELKEGCKALNIETTDTTADTFEVNFEIAKEWCSVPAE